MKTRLIFAAMALCASSLVWGQDSYTVEEISQIGAADTATLDSRSVEAQGTTVRFHVHVRPPEAQQRPLGAAALRVIRYLMRCDDKTLGVSAVLTLNERNEMMKNYMIPPGGMDFFPVAEGSREEEWLKQVCK